MMELYEHLSDGDTLADNVREHGQFGTFDIQFD